MSGYIEKNNKYTSRFWYNASSYNEDEIFLSHILTKFSFLIYKNYNIV